MIWPTSSGTVAAMLVLEALACAAPVAGAGLAEAAAGGAGRVARGAGGFCALGFVGRCFAAAGVAVVARAVAVLRVVAARFFFAALFFRRGVRLGAAALLVARLRLVFVFFRAVARGLLRVTDFRRARVLERAAIVDLPRAGRARVILRGEENRGQRRKRRRPRAARTQRPRRS
ncbi:MAG TPA: hypothetical protein VKM54_15695 [Myxococcota bacterium]|nr:hypothetical protein [Myxococcota bacterium]